MARLKKVENNLVDVVGEVAVMRKVKFFAKYLGFGFDYPAVKADGSQKIKMNNQGQPIYDNEGNEIPIHINVKFQNLSERLSQGYLSCYVWDPNDQSAQNQAIGECLKKMADDRRVAVQDEDAYEQGTNALAYTEKMKVRALEDENAALRATIEKMETPDELNRRLEEMTKG